MIAGRAQAETLFFQGNGFMTAGDLPAAESCFRQAVDACPDFAEGYSNLGYLLERRGADAEAESRYRQALAHNPACAQTHLNLGALLARQQRWDDAAHAYRESLRLNPSATAWSNLGALHACLKHEAEAEQCYRTAIERDPNYRPAWFNLSYLLLRQGRFSEGWQCLEKRDWYRHLEAYLECARWQGEPLDGKSVLIGFEAGHGDMIQFCRYAAELKARGARHISLLCHPGLKTLFASIAAVDQVLPFDESVPTAGWDFWTPPLSIPYYCRTDLRSIPAALPYLYAEPTRIRKWQACLPATGLRVGLVWKGNPQFENDRDRSLPSLQLLAPLGEIPNIHWVSLQKGAGESEARDPPAGLPLIPLGERCACFADMAAIISRLDLVITVDTAAAHLAGALGKPCWLLLPDFKTDWRWLQARQDSPWYPGVMRLFRQPAQGDWAAVIREVQAALAPWAQATRPA